jgi:hypothetical protein
MLAFADGAIFVAGTIGLKLSALRAHRRFGHGDASEQTVRDGPMGFKTRLMRTERFGNVRLRGAAESSTGSSACATKAKLQPNFEASWAL